MTYAEACAVENMFAYLAVMIDMLRRNGVILTDIDSFAMSQLPRIQKIMQLTPNAYKWCEHYIKLGGVEYNAHLMLMQIDDNWYNWYKGNIANLS